MRIFFKGLFIVFLCFFLGYGDSSLEKPKVSPFAGSWRVSFYGTYVGGGTASIATDGSFCFLVYLTGPYGSFTSIISGSVTSKRSCTGNNFYQG